MRITVVGAGTGGLYSAIVLARAGHDVIVVEKDPQPPAIDSATVASWHRPGTPQAHLPHGLVARGRGLLARHAPAELQAAFAAGAVDFDIAACAPGAASAPGDDELRILFARRPLLEHVLWRSAEREPRVELRCATAVTGVGVGVVTTEHGEIRADLVIDAGGRRSPIAKWLGGPEPLVEDCGVIYYSRYYRLRDGAEPPRSPWLWGPRAELPFALAIVHLADRGVHSITFATPTSDAELKALRTPAAFTAVAKLHPLFAPWADEDRCEPIGDVLAMGGLRNVLRERAHVPGVLAIGDALCHTNAAYGWGISLGFAHASVLAEVVRDGRSPEAIATAYHTRVGAEARALWELSLQQDRARLRAWRGEPLGDDVPLAAAARALAPAAMLDGDVFRALMRVSNLLAPPDTLLDDALHARARAAIARAARPAPPPAPSRDAALSAIHRAMH